MIKLPAAGEPVDQLYKTVIECAKFCNALENLEVLVETIDPTKGKIVITEGKATLTLY